MEHGGHLAEARGALAEIEALTETLDGDSTMDEIDDVLRKRDALVCRMKDSVEALTGRDPSWKAHTLKDPAGKRVFEEANALLHSIGEMDRRLAGCMESRMAGIKKQLSSIYTTSRAARSYTAQSTLRTAV